MRNDNGNDLGRNRRPCGHYDLSFFEPVPYATDRFDVDAEIAEFLAEADHLDIDRTLGDGIVFAFHRVDNLAAGESPTGLARKKWSSLNSV